MGGGASEADPVMIMEVGREGPENDARDPEEKEARRDDRRDSVPPSDGVSEAGTEPVFEMEPQARWGVW